MIKVTDEMLDLMEDWASQDEVNKHSAINYVFNIIELHEQSKPKPEPVGYAWIIGEQIQKLADVKLNNSFVPLYTTPPTQKPLSEEFLMALAEECTAQFFNGVHQNATIHFARAVEQAHGIGTSHEPT